MLISNGQKCALRILDKNRHCTTKKISSHITFSVVPKTYLINGKDPTEMILHLFQNKHLLKSENKSKIHSKRAVPNCVALYNVYKYCLS